MLRRSLHHKALNPILVLLLLLASVPSSIGATPPPPPVKGETQELEPDAQISWPIAPEFLRRIEPALLKEVAEGEEAVRFIVYLREGADLAAATADRVSGSERRQAVVMALQATAERSQGGLRAYLDGQQVSGKVRRYSPYWVFNGLAVEGDRETLLALAARPEVKVIRADQKRHLEEQQTTRDRASSTLEWNIAKIRADLVWQALDIDGSGVVVANLDTGVDWQHPALQSKYRGYDPHGLHKHFGNWYCATDEGYIYPGDGYGHGTHTMGTILGAGDPAIGVAPGARWIAAKVFDDQGYTYDSWLHDGFQWLLDPDGDPATDDAPDVVNNSWGSSEGYLETFRPDVQALRAAGIFPVFSAGNYGPGEDTVGSPASFPESFAVGATDSDDYIAVFSGRGPSPWSEVKPEVSAPGISVRSSLPGGGYGERDGTSMAAPHVTGLGALLLEANPSLTVSEMEQAIASTAVSLGNPIPNNSYGWGRIDAYNAVTAVSDAGFLSGTVTDSTNAAALAGAVVTVTPSGGGSAVDATTHSQGHYSLALAPVIYEVTATAFAYEPATASHVVIVTGTTTVQDFALDPSPVGALVGRVTEEGSGTYLSATLTVSGTPATTQTDPATGLYSLALPAGIYDIRVESLGHRVAWAYTVPIVVGEATPRDFALPTAPTILLVDSGAWYGGSEIGYFRQALDDLNYLYDLWTIREPFEIPNDVPTEADLLLYDIVIWSCPEDSPGYIMAWEALTGYLDSGGQLFLTGQDIGYWDGGGSPFGWSPQYGDYLKASYVADDSGTRSLTGSADDIFEGLTLLIEDGDGADNQVVADEIAVADADYATSIIEYDDDGSGGQRVGLCLPYRLVYLSFGFEAVNLREARRQVMERTIDWLIGPRQTVGVELSPLAQTEIGLPATTVWHTVRLRNTGEAGPASTYNLTLSGHTWPTTLAMDMVDLAACDSTDVDLWVDIPLEESWQALDTTVLDARPVVSPTLVATATLTTKTPAPILLVDDDRWYNEEGHYEDALDDNGMPYDYWEVNDGWPWDSPSLEILQRYPAVVWFTSYDWYETLTADEEARLSAYLDGGGRLFFSGQDYLYTRGLTSFGEDYLGILDYTEDMTTTLAVGELGSLVGDSLGPYDLAYPFPNYSDMVTPIVPTEVAFRGDHELPAALAYAAPAYRTVFLAFPFEALDRAAAERVMERVIGWLGWLGTSTLAADRNVVASGGTMTYTLTLSNDGWETVTAHLSDTLPVETNYVADTLSPTTATYDPVTRRVSWGGDLPSGGTMIVNYQVTVDNLLPAGTIITNVADIGYDEHWIAFDRWARTRVNAADLSGSTLEVDNTTARPGDPLSYTITLRNVGVAPSTAASLVNPIPDYTTYIPDSLSITGGGTGMEGGGVITWAGSVDIGSPVVITYGVTVTAPFAGFTITNRADVYDDYGHPVELTATTTVRLYELHFPIIFRGFGSPPQKE
ncbi:MAG: S8 family serine peptidase [Anaerolineae bacterium]